MREASQKEIAIEDMSLPVFMAVLDHLYTDAIEIDSELALPLFAAADRFQIDRLKSLCAAKIEADLAIVNCCHALTVADQHSAFELKEVCISFIVTHFKAVHNTDGFKQLSRPLLEFVHAAISERLYAAHESSPANMSPGGGGGRGGGRADGLSHAMGGMDLRRR